MAQQQLLKGLRVIGLEQAMVLPYGTSFLADWGAEVIRVENTEHLGVERYAGPYAGGELPEDWWNGGGTYTEWNRGKKSVVINIYTPKGKELFLELVKKSDIVADNFRPPTLERAGLDHESLKKVKPDIITLTMNACGSTGPYRGMGSRARTSDSMSGLSYISGYEGDEPLRVSGNYMDHVGGITAALALLAAVHYKRTTGKGMRLDGSMYESGVLTIQPALLEAQRGIDYPRSGSGHAWGKAPYNVYPCKGNDQWVAITVSNDGEWSRLKEALNNPDWAAMEMFDTAIGRWENRKALDAMLGEWTSTQNRDTIQSVLQKHSVPAGGVLNTKDTFEDPQYEERQFFETITPELAVTPSQKRLLGKKFTGKPWRLPEISHTFGPGADFAQHNYEVLHGLLGLSETEINKLMAEGVVANQPSAQEIRIRKPQSGGGGMG